MKVFKCLVQGKKWLRKWFPFLSCYAIYTFWYEYIYIKVFVYIYDIYNIYKYV